MSAALRRLALFAFFALTSSLAGPLWAATGNVSNLTLTAANGVQISENYPSAQAFTTGDHSGGYALQSVTLKLRGSASNLSPELYSDASGSPSASLATLSANHVSSSTMTDVVFTCSSGCRLAKETTYHIVVDVGRLDVLYWGQNTSGNETNTAPTGSNWSIADDAKYQDGADGLWVSEGAVKLTKVSWAAPTLTASSVEATSATLSIADHSGNWYHKYTTPSGGQCSSAVSSGTSANVTLTSGTSYTFKAYSDSSCTSELDSVDLLTKPGKVAGVSATAGNTSLDVSWTATTGAASYKIQWKSGTQEYDATNRQTTSTTASKTLSTLVNGTAYTIRVAAVNATGDGAWSDEAAGTPSAVTLTASNVTSGGATLTLAGHTAAWYYKYTAPSGGECSSAVSAGTAAATLTDLRGSTSYTFNAYSDSSCSTLLATAPAFTTSAPTAPSAPTGLTIRGNSLSCLDGNQNVTSFDFTLDWTAANANGAPVTSHRVFWRKKGTTDWTLKTTLRRPGATIGIAVDTNNLGGSYEVGVRARNSRGWGPQSAYVDFNLSTPPAAPAKPAVEASDRSATLSWRAPSGCGSAVTGYEYVKKTGAGAFETTWTAIPSSASLTAHTVTGLTNNTAYQFKLRAVNSVGNGPESVASDPVTPSPPDLWVEDIRYHTAQIALRNWTGGAWSWKIAGGRSSQCYNSRAPAHSTFQSLNTLHIDTSHTVTAHSGHGCASANQLDSETVTTRASDWQAPALSVASVASTGATLSIANHSGDWWYARKSDSTTCTKVDAGTSSATLSGLTPNKFYSYRAFSGSGCANSSAPLDWITQPVEFTTSGPVTATITDLSETWATLAVSGISSGQWSTDHIVTGDPITRYSQCLTYDYSTASAVVTGLTAGTAYTFYVYRGGNCTYKKDRIATQAHTFRLTAGAIGQSSATLTLEHHEGGWSYRAGQASGQASGGAGAAGQASGGAQANAGGGAGAQSAGANAATGQCQSVPSGTYTAQITGLNANTSYTYTAYAGGNCAGTALGQAQFTTGTAGPTGPPGTPASVTVTRSDGALNAAWPAVDGATSYHVTYTSDNGTSWSLAAENHSTNSIDITGVDNSLTYIVGVRARNQHGDSDWTNSSPADPLPGYAPPDTPSSVTVTRGDGVLNASWPAVDDATSYHITYTSDNGTSWSLAAENHAGTSITISGVDNALTYIVGVRARNEHGDSGWTNSPSVGPFTPEPPEPTDPPAPTEPPGTPSSVTVTRGDGTLHASWPAVPGASSYHVTYSSDNGASWSLAAFSHPDTSITITGVDNALSYIVGVRARNAQGGSGWRNSPSAGPHTGKGGASITLGGEPPGGAPTKTNLAPAFDTGAAIADLSYEQGAVIEPLTLPAATGGDGVLSYALQPALPQGMSFNATTRVLSGTPATRMAAARYTYTVTDTDGDTASLYFRLAATPSARARAEQSVLTDGLASQGRAVLGGARRALDGRFRDADRAIDLSVLRANWSDWQERLTAAAKGPDSDSPVPSAWGQTSSLSPETSETPGRPGSAGDAVMPALPSAFGLSGLSGTCGTAALQETPWPDASDSRVDNGWDDGACNGAASVRLSDWLWGRRYALRLNGIFGNADDEARSGPDWTLWSAGDQHRVEGTPGQNRYETDWRSMHLGLDARFSSDWLAGLVVSRGWGETGYGYEAQGVSGTGELDTDVWTALPYLHGRLGGFEVWGLAGGGWGEITATRSDGDGIKEDSHLNLWLGAVGASRPLLGIGAMSLSFVADAGMTYLTTDKGDGALDGLTAATKQLRMGLAGEYEASIFDGQAELTPFWQLSGRYDGGDGLAGAGLEAQAGLRYRSARLSLVAQGHWLGMHSETGYKEYGASMEARVSPLAHGRGLTFALSPRWGANGALSGAASGMGTGANSAGGIGAMWDTDIVRRAAIANTQAAGNDTAHVWSVDAEVGYGLWLPHRLGLLTPFSDMRLAGGHEQRQRLGLRLDAVGGQGLQLELSGFRASTHLETDTGVNLNATLNY